MVTMLTVDRPPTEPAASPDRKKPLAIAAAVELAVAAGVFLVYRAGRLVTSSSTGAAQRNSERVIEWERSVGAFTEQRVQSWMIDLPGVIEFLNRYYVLVHFPVTIAFLVWVFARRRDQYAQIRNWFTGVTLLALVVHVIFPLAPPRMTDGFVDTLRVFGPNIYTEDTSKSVANQFAAMPSLHFGWALMLAVGDGTADHPTPDDLDAASGDHAPRHRRNRKPLLDRRRRCRCARRSGRPARPAIDRHRRQSVSLSSRR